MTGRIFSAALIAVSVAMSSTAATAHPHMFVDAQSTLIIDENWRLAGVLTALVIDALTTQFVLEEYGIAIDATLTDVDRQTIAQGMVEGLGAYDFFTEIKQENASFAISQATISQVRIDDDLLGVVLDLRLTEPSPLDGTSTEIALFDPTYFAAVTTLGPPILPETIEGCSVDFVRFEPQAFDTVTWLELSKLSREETPDNSRIGARFADRSLACLAWSQSLMAFGHGIGRHKRRSFDP